MQKRYFGKDKILNLVLIICFLFNTFSSSALGALAPTTPAYNLQLPLLRYLSINSANPFNYFNFLLDKGTATDLSRAQSREGSPERSRGIPDLTQEARKLINYFFLGISLSADAFWVNLQPKDADKMTSRGLSRTDMGKVLLEQDLQLKKDVARYLHPDNTFGKIFWERLYTEIGKDKVRREKITTSQRVWIVPDTATVVETADGAFISDAKLKVLLENEYLKAQMGTDEKLQMGTDKKQKQEEVIQASSERLMKEIIIPELTFDINHSSLYAPLRQIYYSLILAEYFKRKHNHSTNSMNSKNSINSNDPYISLINQNTTVGLESELPWSKDKIFQEYLTSYQKGEYQIKRSLLGLARMYFSGGIEINFAASPVAATNLGSAGEVIKTIPADSSRGKIEISTNEEKDGLSTLMGIKNGDAPTEVKPKVFTQEEEDLDKVSSPLIDDLESKLKQENITIEDLDRIDRLFLERGTFIRSVTRRLRDILLALATHKNLEIKFMARDLYAKHRPFVWPITSDFKNIDVIIYSGPIASYLESYLESHSADSLIDEFDGDTKKKVSELINMIDEIFIVVRYSSRYAPQIIGWIPLKPSTTAPQTKEGPKAGSPMTTLEETEEFLEEIVGGVRVLIITHDPDRIYELDSEYGGVRLIQGIDISRPPLLMVSKNMAPLELLKAALAFKIWGEEAKQKIQAKIKELEQTQQSASPLISKEEAEKRISEKLSERLYSFSTAGMPNFEALEKYEYDFKLLEEEVAEEDDALKQAMRDHNHPDVIDPDAAKIFREYDLREHTNNFTTERTRAILAAQTVLASRMGSENNRKVLIAADQEDYNQEGIQIAVAEFTRAGFEVIKITRPITSSLAYMIALHLGIDNIVFFTASHNPYGDKGMKIGIKRGTTFGPYGTSLIKETAFKGLRAKKTEVRGKVIEMGFEQLKESLDYYNEVHKKLGIKLTPDKFYLLINPIFGTVGYDNDGNSSIGYILKKMGFSEDSFEFMNGQMKSSREIPGEKQPNPELQWVKDDMGSRVNKIASQYPAKIIVGVAFDRDGDRATILGESAQSSADKLGVLAVRQLATNYRRLHPGDNMTLIAYVDMKCSLLVFDDPQLKKLNVEVRPTKTGHSYLKWHLREAGRKELVLGAFEQSGHNFYKLDPADPSSYIVEDNLAFIFAIFQYLEENKQSLAEALETVAPYEVGPSTKFYLDPSKFDSQKTKASNLSERKYNIMREVKEIVDQKVGQLVASAKYRFVGVEDIDGTNLRMFFADPNNEKLIGTVTFRPSSNEEVLTINIDSTRNLERWGFTPEQFIKDIQNWVIFDLSMANFDELTTLYPSPENKKIGILNAVEISSEEMLTYALNNGWERGVLREDKQYIRHSQTRKEVYILMSSSSITSWINSPPNPTDDEDAIVTTISESQLDDSIKNLHFGPGESKFDASTKDITTTGGIDLNATKMELKNYASSPLEQKKEFIGKFKTLLCVDALLDKKWFSLSHLYFQEIIHLVKDEIVSELDRDKLLIVASTLKAKGYLIDRQGLEFLKFLESGKPVAEIRFLLSPR